MAAKKSRGADWRGLVLAGVVSAILVAGVMAAATGMFARPGDIRPAPPITAAP